MTKKSETAPEWYSIKEAAKYLSIGEPTLYRWMRDNKITFRKIGDSTRFLKEDLDAVVQVFHSAKEVDKVKKVCPVCNHEGLVDGVFRTTGLNYFSPHEAKFWSLHDRNIKSQAVMCPHCGAITLFGDIKKLEKVISKREEAQKTLEAGES